MTKAYVGGTGRSAVNLGAEQIKEFQEKEEGKTNITFLKSQPRKCHFKIEITKKITGPLTRQANEARSPFE